MINRNLDSENGSRSTQLSNIAPSNETNTFELAESVLNISDRDLDFRRSLNQYVAPNTAVNQVPPNPNSSSLNQSAVLTNEEVSQNRIELQTDDVSNETVVAGQIFTVNIQTLDSIMNVMTGKWKKRNIFS